MTKLHHPHNKAERFAAAERKHSFENDKKGILKAERPAKVRHKLSIEEARLQEIEDELQYYRYN